MSSGKNNRRKGHDAERECADAFREAGFQKCQTSRYGSRMHDDAAIDLIFIPYNVQVKAGKQQGLNAFQVLKEMEHRIDSMFPEDAPERVYPNVLIHRKDGKKGVKRSKYDTLVSLSLEDFIDLVKIN
jgi:hypothetical protein